MNWRWSILWNSYFLGCDNADVVRGQVSWCFYIHIIRKTQIHGNREHGKMVAILITILDYTGVHCTVLSTFLWFWNSCDKEVGKSTINGNLFRESRGKIFFPEEFEGVGRGVEPLEEKSKQKDNYVAQGTQIVKEARKVTSLVPRSLHMGREGGSRSM